MKLYSFLRLFRIVSAVIVILLISLTFFDIYTFTSNNAARYVALTQFFPSFLSFMLSPSVIFSSFIIIILITAAAGRSYCSILCPLGIYQDLITGLSSILRLKNKFSYTPPHSFTRYSIFAAVIISFPAGGTLLIRWLDPFSIYGRFLSGILSPAITGINNIAAAILSKSNIYTMHSVDIIYVSTGSIIIITAIMSAITASAFLNGRLYCSSICPVGTLLGLISAVSFLRIDISGISCTHCGKCEKACKSSCIDHKNEYIDFTRCVSCFNCLNACPNSSIKFKLHYPADVVPDEDEEKTFNRTEYHYRAAGVKIPRKSFISGLVLLPSIISAQTNPVKPVLYLQDRAKLKYYKKKIYTSPPGSLNIDRFNDRCTACSLCITRCPSSVLQPAVLQYGLNGIMQPYLDFNTGYCNYDCIICSEVCPSGAIDRISIAEKHLICSGKSLFIKENCITYTNGTACGACSEHCPTKAVNMVPFKNDLVIPEINQKICTGCGACEFVCPVRPVKAIYVEGSKIHEKAELPVKEKKIIINREDFPF